MSSFPSELSYWVLGWCLLTMKCLNLWRKHCLNRLGLDINITLVLPYVCRRRGGLVCLKGNYSALIVAHKPPLQTLQTQEGQLISDVSSFIIISVDDIW